MKCFIFKKIDSTVVYHWVKDHHAHNLELVMARLPEYLKNLPFVLCEPWEVPLSNSNTGHYHEMIYFDGDCKKENLKHDHEWMVCLMPPFLIREKHLKKVDQKISKCLNDNIFDSLSVLKLLHEQKQCQNWSNEQWYNQALKNLDERVMQGESDKPVIRNKLLEKLSK